MKKWLREAFFGKQEEDIIITIGEPEKTVEVPKDISEPILSIIADVEKCPHGWDRVVTSDPWCLKSDSRRTVTTYRHKKSGKVFTKTITHSRAMYVGRSIKWGGFDFNLTYDEEVALTSCSEKYANGSNQTAFIRLERMRRYKLKKEMGL